MWFPVLSLLLIITKSLQGNEDITLPLKELHYKVSKVVSKIVEESKVIPELELAEKIEKVLEEYTEIDVSSGLPELIELLELKKKADDLKLNKLENMRRGGPANAYSRLNALVNNMRKVIERSKTIRQDIEKNLPRHGDYDRFRRGKALDALKDDFTYQYRAFLEEFDKVDKHPISFNFVGAMKGGIAGGKEKSAEIRKWNEDSEISQKILSVKAEIQVLEELRDGEAIQRMLGLIEKLEGSFEGMRGPELKPLQYQISYSLRKMTPIRNHLKRLNISSGNLTDPLGKIESCLQNYDFSMDFSTEEEEFKKIEETLNEIRTKNEQFLKILNEVQEFRKKLDWSLEHIYDHYTYFDRDWLGFRMIWLGFERDADVEPL
ncbi:hypothetical protein CAEBREN_12538 [Caenorhabditis brenneri]|uniref:Domain of unknown function WSN domain-containing protein n=1 Tax=Caenorhabditis brenneri TaxID=135651 RepID=G0NZZ9_CAEBE|nr:hypothetical protein CAEBREN_12538 [Caenorhabditis brenneri]